MRKKLLLADDSITIQKVVELTFPADDFEVMTAANGRLALEKALTFLPDILLCDVIMPHLDGYQVCEAFQRTPQLKDVPILLLNGAFEPYDAARAKAVGALGNVSKPFDPPALVARVKEILAERAPVAAAPPPIEEITTIEPMEAAVVEAPVDDAAVEEAAPAVGEASEEEYTLEDSGTRPVSTAEVPTDVREMAARSLSMDAPVFAPPEPEVLTAEPEPADFSETLHDPMAEEAGIEPVETEGAGAALSAGAPAEAEPEPVDFEPEALEAELPATLPPGFGPRTTPAPPVEAARPAGEQEFEPDFDMPAPAPVSEAESDPVTAEPAPAEVEIPETETPPVAAIPDIPVAEFMAHADVDAAPAPEPEPVTPEMEEPAAPGPAVEAVAELPDFEEDAEVAAASAPAATPEPAAVAAAAAAEAPSSAEVAVPVDMVQQIAQRVISQVSERVIREIAWDVIPSLAEQLIKAEIERIKARAESEHD